MDFDLSTLVRKNIQNLKPYSSARHEFEGEASVFLDANENSFGSPVAMPQTSAPLGNATLNRYPDPLQWQLKFAIAKIKGVPAENMVIGNGSDEIIDLAFRIFCEPAKDNVIICPPTYGMYEVSAGVNDVAIQKVPLTKQFQLDTDRILQSMDQNTKLLFLCSPNNPTGNSMQHLDVEMLLNNFPGIVVIDEAYINFSKQKTFIAALTEYPNLVVMQTLSKAWGLASLRLGLAFASLDIINLFNKVKPPYNINLASQNLALQALQNIGEVNGWIKKVVSERFILAVELEKLPIVQKVYESDANFLLVKFDAANEIYQYLLQKQIVVRNRSSEAGCENCLRITVGTEAENSELITVLKAYKKH